MFSEKENVYNKKTIPPYVTSGTQLTNRAVLTLITFFSGDNSPAKLPGDKRERFPEKVQDGRINAK